MIKKYACKFLHHGGPLRRYIIDMPYDELCKLCQIIRNQDNEPPLRTTPEITPEPDIIQRDDMISSIQPEFVNMVFNNAAHEHFEVGYNSRFTDRLDELYERGGDFFLYHIRQRLVDNIYKITNGRRDSGDVIAEMLSWAVRKAVEDGSIRTKALVYSMCVDALYHDDLLVNDNATLGLREFLEDKYHLNSVIDHVIEQNSNFVSDHFREELLELKSI